MFECRISFWIAKALMPDIASRWQNVWRNVWAETRTSLKFIFCPRYLNTNINELSIIWVLSRFTKTESLKVPQYCLQKVRYPANSFDNLSVIGIVSFLLLLPKTEIVLLMKSTSHHCRLIISPLLIPVPRIVTIHDKQHNFYLFVCKGSTFIWFVHH